MNWEDFQRALIDFKEARKVLFGVVDSGDGIALCDFFDEDTPEIVCEALRLLSSELRNDKTQFAWLIESGSGTYWDGSFCNDTGFTKDANSAVRFSRGQDADKVIHWLLKDISIGLKAVEHGFMSKDYLRQPPPEDLSICKCENGWLCFKCQLEAR